VKPHLRYRRTSSPCAGIEGGCQVPIACVRAGKEWETEAYSSRWKRGRKRIIKDSIEGEPEKAEKLGVTLAEKLLSQGADVILREVYGNTTDFSGNIF